MNFVISETNEMFTEVAGDEKASEFDGDLIIFSFYFSSLVDVTINVK